MESTEILQVEDYLRKMFQLEEIKLKRGANADGPVVVYIGEKPIGLLTKDDEDEDVSYDLEMPVPGFDQDFLRKTFRVDTIEIRKRPNKDDSVEVYMGEEFLGVIFATDDSADPSYAFNMAILDFDLEDL